MFAVIRSAACGLGLFMLAAANSGLASWTLASIGVVVVATLPWTWRAARRDGRLQVGSLDWVRFLLCTGAAVLVLAAIALWAHQPATGLLAIALCGSVTVGAALADGLQSDRLARQRRA